MRAARSETLFGEQAVDYERYRPAYPAALFQLLLERTDGRGVAVDLGAGTGRVTVPLLDAFDRVIAIEPDERMAALLPDNDKLLVVNQKAEDAVLPFGAVDLITCGTAFHWMDGPSVLLKLSEAARADGLLAIFTYYRPDPGPVGKKVTEEEFAARWNNHKHDRLQRGDYAKRQVTESRNWQDPEQVRLTHDFEMSADDLAGFFASTSYGASYLRTLDDPADYVAELAGRYRAAIGQDPFPVTMPVEVILSRPTKDR